MSLRDNLVILADEFWANGNDAAERKSWIEARVYKDAANRLRSALGMPALEGGGNGRADQ